MEGLAQEQDGHESPESQGDPGDPEEGYQPQCSHEGHEGHEAHQGHEGDEGHWGHEGQGYHEVQGHEGSQQVRGLYHTILVLPASAMEWLHHSHRMASTSHVWPAPVPDLDIATCVCQKHVVLG